MPKPQFTMFPEHGGEPLPRSPIIAPYMAKHAMAKEYVAILKAELEAEHNNQPKWRGAQRAQIKLKLSSWTMKAEGKDEHFEKHGTFRRPFQSEPVGPMDYIAEKWRREQQEKGTWVSNQAHRRKVIRPGDAQRAAIERLRKKHGTKTIDPPKD